mgnify:CR=1 FL=1
MDIPTFEINFMQISEQKTCLHKIYTTKIYKQQCVGSPKKQLFSSIMQYIIWKELIKTLPLSSVIKSLTFLRILKWWKWSSLNDLKGIIEWLIGKRFNQKEFLERLRKKLDIPVFDVLSGGWKSYTINLL